MAMSRAKKQTELEACKARFNDAETIVIAEYSGLTVAQITDLRGKLRASGASFKVNKNTLARRAAEGTKFEGVVKYFKGPVGIASSKDPVAAAKVIHEYAKENEKLVIKGGAMGATILDAKGVEALAKMPSLDELRGKIVGILVTPQQRIATLCQAPAAQIARVISAKATKE